MGRTGDGACGADVFRRASTIGHDGSGAPRSGQARRLDPSLSSAWRVLGSSAITWTGTTRGRAEFPARHRAQPVDASSLSWYGDFLLDMRRFDEARVSYKRAHDANPRWLEPPIFAANVHTFTGNPALAILEQRRTLESEPNYGLGNHFLGRAYLASQDWPMAIDFLRKSNDIVGSVPFTLGDLGYRWPSADRRMRQCGCGRS